MAYISYLKKPQKSRANVGNRSLGRVFGRILGFVLAQVMVLMI